MLGVSHATSAAAVWLAVCAAVHAAGQPVEPLPALVGGVVCLAGSLVPDFDHPRSIASNCLPPITNVFAWLVRRLSRAVYVATAMRGDRHDDDAGTHRALTHTAAFAVLAGAVLAGVVHVVAGWWPPAEEWMWLGWPLGLGCLIHVAGDCCTRSGCPVLWPVPVGGLRWRRFGAPIRFVTGGRGEAVAMTLLICATGAAVLWSIV